MIVQLKAEFGQLAKLLRTVVSACYWCSDVVTAYKELQREKVALEESLKALSLSRPAGDECVVDSQRDVDTASDLLHADDSSICSEASDLHVTAAFYCWWTSSSVDVVGCCVVCILYNQIIGTFMWPIGNIFLVALFLL